MTAPQDVHFATTWHKAMSTGCWGHTLTVSKYTSLRGAQAACARSASCSGVHDVVCQGIYFFMCDAAHNFSTPADTIAFDVLRACT